MSGTTKTHPVTLKLQGQYVVAVPKNLRNMRVGDKVRFNSNDGEFKVVFGGKWPFEGKKHIVRDDKPLTFQHQGPFDFYCYIAAPRQSRLDPTTSYNKPVGRRKWISYPGTSGGTGNVKPPGG